MEGAWVGASRTVHFERFAGGNQERFWIFDFGFWKEARKNGALECLGTLTRRARAQAREELVRQARLVFPRSSTSPTRERGRNWCVWLVNGACMVRLVFPCLRAGLVCSGSARDS
jgi:hypothetical protein